MARFTPAFELMIRNEGGYQLHQTPGDNGGLTYAGISRRYHPDWPGWNILSDSPNDSIDDSFNDSPRLALAVKAFYRTHFWHRIKGDAIENQVIANCVFDFAVNAGVRVASKLAQEVVHATPDGIIGNNTLQHINAHPVAQFIPAYTLAKITRYAAICNKDRSQNTFLLGWINRALKGVTAGSKVGATV